MELWIFLDKQQVISYNTMIAGLCAVAAFLSKVAAKKGCRAVWKKKRNY